MLCAGLTVNYLPKQLLWGVPKERHAAHQKLIQNDAHRPPVDGLPVALPQDHLWGDILWRPAHLENKNIRLKWRASTGVVPEGNTTGVMVKKHTAKQRTCLSMNSLVSFSMCPSYRLVVMFIRPIFESPKSVSLMCPMDVINKLQRKRTRRVTYIIEVSKSNESRNKTHLSGLRSLCTMP